MFNRDRYIENKDWENLDQKWINKFEDILEA